MYKSKFLTNLEFKSLVQYVNIKKEVNIVVYKEIAGIKINGNASKAINRIFSLWLKSGHIERLRKGEYKVIKEIPLDLPTPRTKRKRINYIQ